jgi:hypothetical protein
MHQRLIIVQNGCSTEKVQSGPLRHGAEGNEQTLRYAAQMVREDSAQDIRLRSLAEQLTAGCAPHDVAGAVRVLFEFARDGIRYVDDPVDVERIADAWTTVESRAGDCGDKSILLASLLGAIGIKSQFIVQSWAGDLSNGYDHVHVEVPGVGSQGSGVSETIELDPTNEHAPVGWEAVDAKRARFEIWSGAEVGGQRSEVSKAGMDFTNHPSPVTHHHLSGFLEDFGGPLIGAGIQVGSQFASSSAQQSKVTAQQGKAISAQFENLVSQALQVFKSIDARMPYVTADDVAYAQQAYQVIESFVSQYPTDYVTQQWNSAAYKGAAQSDIAKFAAAAAQPQVSGQLAVGGGQSLQPGSLSFGLGTTAALGTSISVWAIAGVALFAILVLKK